MTRVTNIVILPLLVLVALGLRAPALAGAALKESEATGSARIQAWAHWADIGRPQLVRSPQIWCNPWPNGRPWSPATGAASCEVAVEYYDGDYAPVDYSVITYVHPNGGTLRSSVQVPWTKYYGGERL